MSNPVSRRQFLGASSLAAAAAVSVGTARQVRAAAGSNERLRVALIGCGGQGRHDLYNILEAGGAGIEVVALCDVDKRQSASVAKECADRFHAKPDIYLDFHKIIDRKDIDIVSIGTPDHWHAIPMILACQSGKDVYVEKPIAHNIKEGRAMVEAAKKYKRIVQVGMQQRSDAHFREAAEYLQKGSPLGVISRTATYNYGNETPNGIGNPPDTNAPEEVDYNLWLGPAPKRMFNPNRFHWSWRWFFDYAGGMMCDWNVHIQDIVHWAMGVDAPLSIVAYGPGPAEGYKRVLKDNRETPDMMDVVYEYKAPDGHLFTQSYLMTKVYQQGVYSEGYGTEFHGTEGSLFINRSGWQVRPEMRSVEVDDPDNQGKKKSVQEPRTPKVKKPGGDAVLPHAKNFLDCVRSRKVEDLHCWIEVGHRTATACHLGNIALKVGRKIWWDRDRELVLNQDGKPDKEANKYLGREYRKGFELPKV